MDKLFDHEHTGEIVCPYCGVKFTDSWEYSSDSGEAECGECEKEFHYCRNVSVTYTTSKGEK